MGQSRVAAEPDRRMVTPEIAAEAAVWVARLHGPDRSPRMERECQAWLAASETHRLAFERCTETWQEVSRVTLDNAYAAGGGAARVGRPAWRSSPGRWGWALALAGVLVSGTAVLMRWADTDRLVTGVGEQRQLVLEDGTRVSLNTDTQMKFRLDAAARTVSIRQGEAIFEVAKDPGRPFVVRVANSEVVALGTAFAVRLRSGEGALAVTLIEGEVVVRPSSGGEGVAPARPVRMQAGERLRLSKVAEGSGHGVAQVTDRPSIEQVVAWRRGEVVFDDASLADAVGEMNRYSRTRIVLIDAAVLAGLRVSGVYRAGDNAGFAHAVAALHGLRLDEKQGRLELAKTQ